MIAVRTRIAGHTVILLIRLLAVALRRLLHRLTLIISLLWLLVAAIRALLTRIHRLLIPALGLLHGLTLPGRIALRHLALWHLTLRRIALILGRIIALRSLLLRIALRHIPALLRRYRLTPGRILLIIRPSIIHPYSFTFPPLLNPSGMVFPKKPRVATARKASVIYTCRLSIAQKASL